MNLAALPQILGAWLKTQGTALLDSGKEIAPPKPTFQPGETYQGKVMDNLAGGRALVRVGGQHLDMALPRGVQVGDTVKLTYLHAVPRPTFVLEQAAAASGPQAVRLSSAAQQLTALAQLARPAGAGGLPATLPADAAGARPILANAAPLVTPPSVTGGGGLPMTALTGAFATATALSGGAPVESTRAGLASGPSTSNLAALQSGAADSQAALPQRLHQTVRESGLFYEAHLARWTQGAFSLAELRREPQAHLAPGSVSINLPPELAGMPEEAARMAGKQLLMLEGAPFLWQGLAWPGQWMEWQVEERPGGEGGNPEEPNTWATELRMTLPRLGGVTARVSMAGERLTLGLSAADSSTRAAMSAALPELEQALTAAGLKPAGLSVDGDLPRV